METQWLCLTKSGKNRSSSTLSQNPKQAVMFQYFCFTTNFTCAIC